MAGRGLGERRRGQGRGAAGLFLVFLIFFFEVFFVSFRFVLVFSIVFSIAHLAFLLFIEIQEKERKKDNQRTVLAPGSSSRLLSPSAPRARGGRAEATAAKPSAAAEANDVGCGGIAAGVVEIKFLAAAAE